LKFLIALVFIIFLTKSKFEFVMNRKLRCAAISTKIKSIENDHPKVKSLILSSSNPSIFSAGIDLKELYSPCPERLPKFWTAFQNLFVDLYGSRLAVIGAIEGHAPAAGCMLAMACDYRIMAASVPGEAPFKIGLNETRFGIVAPPWMAQLMIRTIGFRKAEHALSLGTLFTPENARNIGLVDELVPTSQNVLEICRKTAEKWNEIPMQARSITKMLTRKELLEELISTREGDKENFCKLVQSEPVQTALGLYLKRLKRK